jgi:hypothetical protein
MVAYGHVPKIITSIAWVQTQQLLELANFFLEVGWTDICQRDVAPAQNKKPAL